MFGKSEKSLPDSEWCTLLGYVEFEINSMQAEGTGRAPAELVYGQQLKSPLDVVVGAAGGNVEA